MAACLISLVKGTVTVCGSAAAGWSSMLTWVIKMKSRLRGSDAGALIRPASVLAANLP